MGLDVLEFAIELEQALQIRLDEATVAGWRNLKSVVWSVLPARAATGGCASQRAFHRIRAGLVRRGRVRHILTTEYDLGDVSRSVWVEIENDTGLRFPRRMVGPAARAALGAGVLASMGLGASKGLGGAAAGFVASVRVAASIDHHLGSHQGSLGELAVSVGWRNSTRLGCWSEAAVWNVVQHAAAAQADWPLEDCRPRTALCDLFPDG